MKKPVKTAKTFKAELITENCIVIYESNALSIARDFATMLSIFSCLFGCLLNYRYCGNSTIISLIFGSLFVMSVFCQKTNQTKKFLSKEEMMKFINDKID